jgi:hypothetical protein
MPDRKKMTDAQRAYEAKRAAKAGKSLDSWLDQKRKRQEQEAKAAAPAGSAAPKKPGLLRRLIDRAHKPLG